MKKWLFASLALSMMLMLTAPVGAEPSNNEAQQTEANKSSDKGWLKKADFMEKYRDDWSELNQLEKEKLQLRIQMLDQREILTNLMMDAKKKGDLTKLKPAAELHQMMKSAHKEKKELHTQYKDQRKMMVEAMKNEDDKQMKQALKKMIALKKQKNKLCKERIEATNKLIKQLS